MHKLFGNFRMASLVALFTAVLFITDANYGFPLLRSIARRVGNQGQDLEEFILVGLSYAVGDTPEYSRRRDYTPSAGGDKEARSDMPGRPPVFGQAEAYRQFVASEVFPFMAAQYRAPRRDAIDIVRDMRTFERTLKSRRYPGLQIHSTVIADEDHLTVAPAVLTRGLLWALGGRER